MKRYAWSITLGGILVVVSTLCYLAQILIFHNPHDTFFYMVQDFAFVPVQVLLVTLIVNDFISRREKHALQSKLNMVIGAFFSEMGVDLITLLSRIDTDFERLRPMMAIDGQWTEKDFRRTRQQLQERQYTIRADAVQLAHMKSFLLDNRHVLLTLLENPNLLEHESFTDLLWAISHLMEELRFRDSLHGLPETDLDHLAGDVKRAYALLLIEWLAYTRHLKEAYPYMFSLVARTNPFSATPSPVVR